ncbi:hypothetical protein V5799_010647 [Amblyomma americanum]|uniref:Uncharacterized protein n=1 Tax=Amblyomma americanum TaxID=6943 RepID=A0AAQ4EJF3_AMBAM
MTSQTVDSLGASSTRCAAPRPQCLAGRRGIQRARPIGLRVASTTRNACEQSICSSESRRQRKPGTKLFHILRDSRSKVWIEYGKRDDLLEKSPTQLY